MSKWLVTSAVAAILGNVAVAAFADNQPASDPVSVSTSSSAQPQVVVTASRVHDRAGAIREKQQALNIIDVQPLSEIKKLPDVNMAEALQRVPGISLETDTGEGRFVHIRGMDADLNGVTYGGVRLPASDASSPSGGDRAVAFDTFPTGIVGGVEVTKTLEPDMDAEGLGGSINLIPRTGAEHGGAPFLDADLGGGEEDLRQTPVYHADVSAGRSFDGGDGIGGLFAGPNAFSAVVDLVYHDDQRGIDDIEEDYDDQQANGVPDKVLQDLQFRRYLYHRRRYGAAANFDAKPTDSTSLYLRVLYSGYIEAAYKHYLVLNNLNSNDGCTPLPACITDPTDPNGFIGGGQGGDLEQDTTDSLERIQTGLGMIGGATDFGGFTLDYRASYAVGSDNTSSGYGSTWLDPNPVPIAYDTTTDPRYPQFHTLDGTNPADPANYTLSNIGYGPSYNQDAETAAVADITIPIGGGDHKGALKMGISARLRHRTSSAMSPTWTPNGTISLASYTYGPPQIFYNDLYDIGPAINLQGIRELIGSNLGTISDDPIADASQSTDDQEDVYAGYVQYAQRFGKAGVLAGVRVESTDAKYSGNIFDPGSAPTPSDPSAPTTPESNTPTTVKNSYTNYFPTLQGRYNLLDNLVGRLTYSTGIARPGFQQITPGAHVNLVSATVQVGNPKLKPTTGQSFDADLEWYPGNGQIAALGLFYKDFHDYVLQTEQFVQGYPYPNLTNLRTEVDSFVNGPAHDKGVEGQYQETFTFLPQPLDGLGVNLNFTLADSWAQIHPGIEGLMPSTSKVTWNAAVFYEKGPLEMRVAADYVGRDLFSFGSILGNATDVYSQPRLTMDVGTSYALTHGVRFYLDAKNLLNTPLEFTEGTSTERPIQREFYDMTFLAGIRVSI